MCRNRRRAADTLGEQDIDLAGKGLRVNAVAPGTIRTPAVARMDQAGAARRLLGAVTEGLLPAISRPPAAARYGVIG